MERQTPFLPPASVIVFKETCAIRARGAGVACGAALWRDLPVFLFLFFPFYRLRIVQVMLSSSMSHVASKFCFTFGLKVRPLHGSEGGP